MNNLRDKLNSLIGQIEDIIGEINEPKDPPTIDRQGLKLSDFAKTIPANNYAEFLGAVSLSIFSREWDLLVELKNLQFVDTGASLSLMKAGKGKIILDGAAHYFRVTSNKNPKFYIEGTAGGGGCDLTVYPNIFFEGCEISINTIDFCF